jgi:hypothetical protein
MEDNAAAARLPEEECDFTPKNIMVTGGAGACAFVVSIAFVQ